jgi:hypothetical protein
MFVVFKHIVSVISTHTHKGQSELNRVGFQILTATNMKMADLWGFAPCSLVETDQRFRDAKFFHHQLLVMLRVKFSETFVTRQTRRESY